jgi:invasion protein IalB
MIRPMITASLQRGIAAGILSALVAIGTGPAALAQSQRPAQKPARAAPAKPAAAKATPAKPSAARSLNAKPAAAAAAGGAAAVAAARPAQAATGPGGASLVTSYGDWGVYTAQTGRSKICYALSQPQDRLPKNLNRDPAYLFVSFRPAENVKNEVALVLGFTAKENAPAEAAIGNASYALITKAASAWLKNPAEEGQAITTMMRSGTMVIKSQSARGSSLTDRYSLNGFSKALDHARKECAS